MHQQYIYLIHRWKVFFSRGKQQVFMKHLNHFGSDYSKNAQVERIYREKDLWIFWGHTFQSHLQTGLLCWTMRHIVNLIIWMLVYHDIVTCMSNLPFLYIHCRFQRDRSQTREEERTHHDRWQGQADLKGYCRWVPQPQRFYCKYIK